MFTKIIATSATIAALTIGMHAAGIINLKTAHKDLGLVDEVERHHTIAAVDITAGREGEIEKDFASIRKIMEKAGPGDKIEVFLVHSRAESSQEAIFSAELPDDPGPMGMLLSKAKEAAVASFAEAWDKNVNKLLGDRHLIQQTDLLGFLRFVSQRSDFRKSKHPELALYTDAQQVGDGLNFERMAPDEKDLKRVKDTDLMAELGGVRLIMAGVTPTHNISNSHWRKLQSWWRNYLKETGAEVIAITSERTL